MGLSLCLGWYGSGKMHIVQAQGLVMIIVEVSVRKGMKDVCGTHSYSPAQPSPIGLQDGWESRIHGVTA